ncbi:MAG: hypothetical protein AAFN79_09725 [Pseudomonadota bacterium]
MDITTLLIALALGTIAIVAAFAYANKRNVEKEIDDDKKSTLAADAPNQR